MTSRLVVSVLGLCLGLLPCHLAWSGATTPEAPPDAVREAIATSPPPSDPTQVVVGAYINDIQQIDF
ncbi:MAG: hypothetical protein ACOYB4_02410, partial [Methyloceanibacter sp.]